MFKLKKTSKNDLILILSAISLLVLSGILVFQFSSFEFRIKTQAPKIIGQAELTIDFGNGEKRAFSGDIVENETLIVALIQVSKAGDFSYKLDEKSNLAAIEKFVTDGKKSWHWYLNDKKVDKFPSEITLRPADKILIKYE